MKKLIILGSGPAALTAALYAARARLEPLIIQGLLPGGQLMKTTYVENWPGEQKILGPDLMNNMIEQVKKWEATFVDDEAIALNKEHSYFRVTTHRNVYDARAIIIATGAMPKRLNIPGEQEYWGKGVTTCATCDGVLYANKPVVIIGGGDTAMENALFMARYTKDITIIQDQQQLTGTAVIQEQLKQYPAIKILYSTQVIAIEGDNNGIKHILIKNTKSGKEQVILARAVFVSIGLTPNTGFLKNVIELDNWGYIVLKEKTQTSIPGIFAAGDVADYRYRQAITAAGSGCAAALDAEHFLNAIKR